MATKKKSRPSQKHRFRRFIGQLFLIVLGIGLLALGITVLQVLYLRTHNPSTTSWMRMRRSQAEELGKSFVIRHSWIPLKQLPGYVPQAIIAAEDAGFYQHHGFEWDAIRKAYSQNERVGRIKRGGSTITQQLAKNLYLTPKRNYIRKAREGVITVIMERLLTKDRILELYLNSIEFGPGVFGIEAAAQYHFDISASKLTVAQACRLAAIIPSPLRYKINGEYVSKRAERIGRAM